MTANMQKITKDYNHDLSQKIVAEAWYAEGVEENNIELQKWLEAKR